MATIRYKMGHLVASSNGIFKNRDWLAQTVKKPSVAVSIGGRVEAQPVQADWLTKEYGPIRNPDTSSGSHKSPL